MRVRSTLRSSPLVLAVALLVILAAAALLVVNTLVIPRLVDRAERTASRILGSDVSIGHVSYLPMLGIDVHSISISRDLDAPLVGRTRVTAVASGLRLHRAIGPLLRLMRTQSIATGAAPMSNATATGAATDGGAAPPTGVARTTDASPAATDGNAGANAVAPIARVISGGWSFLDANLRARLFPRSVRAHDVSFALAGGDPAGNRTMTISDLSLSVDRRAGRVSVTARGSRATAFSVDVTADAAARVARIALDLSDVAVGDGAALSTAFSANVVTEVRDTTVRFSGGVELADLTIDSPALADESIGPLGVSYTFAATLDPSYDPNPSYRIPPPFPVRTVPPGRFAVERGTLTVNGVSMSVAPALVGLVPVRPTGAGWTSTPRTLILEAQLPGVPIQSIVRALPAAILGDLAGIELDGTLGWQIGMHVPLDAIGDMEWKSSLKLDGFAVRAIPRSVDPFTMNDAFRATVGPDEVGGERTIAIPAARLPDVGWSVEIGEHTQAQVERIRGANAAQARLIEANPPVVIPDSEPGMRRYVDPDPTYRYVRLEEMSPWIVKAVLTGEDGDFFFHHGVNFYTLPRALERNARAGEIELGASTITMQTVKMLFLDAQRIVSRKLQEVFLVYLVEQVVPVSKERILEIYLNIAELGPGIYGVAAAAQRYFNKDPADLDVGEATWLASILPSPRRYYRYFEDGAISDAWFNRMKAIYAVMLERGRMSDDEYRAALTGPPSFARPDS